MGKRKERRLAAKTNAGRRVKLDLFAEPSGTLSLSIYIHTYRYVCVYISILCDLCMHLSTRLFKSLLFSVF